MPDLDPAIWDNERLGEVTTNENLERLTRQQLEDRAAKFEDREPREIVVENTYPGWTPPVHDRTGTVLSNYTPVHFADERPNDVVQADENIKPEGMSDEEWNGEAPTNPEEAIESRDENSTKAEFPKDEASEDYPTSDGTHPEPLADGEVVPDETNSTEGTKWE